MITTYASYLLVLISLLLVYLGITSDGSYNLLILLITNLLFLSVFLYVN